MTKNSFYNFRYSYIFTFCTLAAFFTLPLAATAQENLPTRKIITHNVTE